MRVRLMEMSSLSRKSRVFTQIASLAQEETTSPGCSEGNAEMIMNCASEKGRSTVGAAGRSRVPRVPVGESTAMRARPRRNQDERDAAWVGQFGSTSAPRWPHRIHTMPSPSDLIRVLSGRWPTFMIVL